MKSQLRLYRAMRKVSQRKLAKDLGMEVTRLWAIENDYKEPTPEEQQKLAEALEVSQRTLWKAEPSSRVA